MLKNIRIKNFKSLKNIDYEAVSLNVLMGLNGVGKSSFTQVLILMKQLASSPKQFSGDFNLSLNDDFLSLGTLKDIFYCYSTGNEISFSFSMDGQAANELTFSINTGNQSQENDIVALKTSEHKSVRNFLDYCQSIQYLSANRLGPQQEHFFFSSKIHEKNWGVCGENAVAFLAEFGSRPIADAKMMFRQDDSDGSLQSQVNSWMSVISPGTNIHADKMVDISKALLSVSFAKGLVKNKFRPQNVGFGISYTLPIIIMLLMAKKGDCLIIENPEAHIHPKGQAELGRLLALCASTGVQLFIETHSDHIINGIRVAVKKQLIERKDIRIGFFKRAESDFIDSSEQYTVIDTILIDQNGELSDYPDGFMDEWNNQLMELF